MAIRMLEPEQKALEINLDDKIYGAFAEIGAGQEVAAHFFHAGAAAGTIAKTMSAYDKVVSDNIYGPEEKGRYVCLSRLDKMLDHEYELMDQRLRKSRPEQCFFAFADTVSAINYQRTYRGHGWLGLRFQLHPDTPPNDLILHVHLQDPNNRLQQQAIGILGVNMIYGCYRHFYDPEQLLVSLMDNLHFRIEIDLVRLTGPDFKQLDNRLLCLWGVKHGLSNVAMFGPDKLSLHASEFLYRRPVLIARGSYRPVTLVHQDMIRSGMEQFKSDLADQGDKAFFLAEITTENLASEGSIDERDFLDRADVLCALGQTVIVSSCVQLKTLISYFSDYKVPTIGLIMGVKKLQRMIEETHSQSSDHLLEAFGEIFLQNVRFYIYPAQLNDQGQLLSLQNLELAQEIKFLIAYLKENKHIVDLTAFEEQYLNIHHKDCLLLIKEGNPKWEQEVPEKVVEIIKEKRLFGYHPSPVKQQ
jgi:hypothetical protein